MSSRAALFLDRDNTLVADNGYLHQISDFRWLDGAPDALRFARMLDIPVFIVTNQGGIGRGIFTTDEMHQFNAYLMTQAADAGAEIADIAYCPHHPQAIFPHLKTPCSCRKPEPGMLLSLAEKWQINLSSSVMIGDRQSDIEAGEAAGCITRLYHPEENLLHCVKSALEQAGLAD